MFLTKYGIFILVFSDEPVTEAYTFLGFPLGWDTRRGGGGISLSLSVCVCVLYSRYLIFFCCPVFVFLGDCVCKTCHRQFHVPHIGLKRTCACGDSKVESVCKMCYLKSDVLHPIRGGFTFGQENFDRIRV